MTKEQILEHPAFKYISGLSNRQRFYILFGKTQTDIEKNFNVKIENYHFTKLPEIEDGWITLSVNDSFKNESSIAVLKPIKI